MAAAVLAPPPNFATVNRAALADLQVTSASFTPGVPIVGPKSASVPFTAHLVLAGLGPWDYQSTLPLRVVKRQWYVEWSPEVINPSLAPGLHFARSRALAPRAAVLADGGTPLSRVPGTSEILGQTGLATATTAATLGPDYVAGDGAGTSGIEAAYNTQLAGQPSGGIGVADSSDRTLKILYQFPGAAPAPITTTIDPAIQAVAEQVMAPVANNGALVAIDTTTGEVRAIVNHPDGGYPRALIGTYPAGSTFKVVTATAALEAGFTLSTTVSCPPSITVGKVFTNAEHEVLGTISFEEAFAKSCNTAFIGTAEKLTDAQLVGAADLYGLNNPWAFPIPHYGGQLPPPASATEHAADAIGQGRVSVSPLEMCSIAAAVANGAWRAPRLVVGAPAGPSTPIPPTVVTELRTMMRAVVTGGTGTAANLAGAPVYAKTGTAEYGTANPPATDAWFIGWRGTIAFAVLVEDGGFGGSTAAPLAAEFLSRIPQS
jgi:cell division protein FtsI/penicillin-binding protein 2